MREEMQPYDIMEDVRDGLSRLTRLDLIRCRGNVLSLVEFIVYQIEIINLQAFSYESCDETARNSEKIIMEIVIKYPTLASIRLEAEFNSSASLLEVINLEKLREFGLDSIRFYLFPSFEVGGC
jgi:hypothetical protein